MKIGIIVAMGKELRLLTPLIDNVKEITDGRFRFYRGKLGDHEVVAMQCGIGKVNAALGTQRMIELFSPELVINTGVAGGAGTAAGILDVVAGERVAYHDVWCGPGTEPGEAADCPLYFEGDKRAIEVIKGMDGARVKCGLIASGDVFVADAGTVERIKGLYPEVLAIDMESASIAQTCYLAGVPFFSLRVVSDTPGAEDNIAQYENFWEDAPRHTFECLTYLLNNL